MLGIKIEIVAIALEICKIFTNKKCHSNNYFCLISKMCLQYFAQKYLLEEEKLFTRQIFAMFANFCQICEIKFLQKIHR